MWQNWCVGECGCLGDYSIRVIRLLASNPMRAIPHHSIANKRKHILNVLELLFAATAHMVNATAPGALWRITTLNHETNQE